MPVPYRIDCPYCGEVIELLLDESVADQCYIEDCAVCCQGNPPAFSARQKWS
ncbi:CPXCG motif-containing cysteine-rich protein [Dyella agri]|uniref:CPXCG motif-containing cysteine-rich protein n=1 Tax=Dyella agri TaxID=1926869 RepID=A0ABW8KM40_9GAMM